MRTAALKRSHPKAIFFVSPYVNQEGQNKEQKLLELAQKIPPILANLGIVEKIAQFRTESLEKLNADLATNKLKADNEKSAEKNSLASDTSKINEDDEWGGSSNTSTPPKGLPGSQSKEDSW